MYITSGIGGMGGGGSAPHPPPGPLPLVREGLTFYFKIMTYFLFIDILADNNTLIIGKSIAVALLSNLNKIKLLPHCNYIVKQYIVKVELYHHPYL